MKIETLSILEKVKNGELTPQAAQKQLFVLFGVSVSLLIEYEMLFDSDIVSGWYPMSQELVERVIADGKLDYYLNNGIIRICNER